MPRFELNDSDVVVIVGSGAGGGTMANELTRRGLKVVMFEAGKRQTLASFSQNPSEAFGQLTWLEPRSQSGTWDRSKLRRHFPLGTAARWAVPVHWTGATPRLQPYEVRARSVYGESPGLARRLADRLRGAETLVPGCREAPRRHAPQRQSRHARLEQFQGDVCRSAAPRLNVHTNYRDQFSPARRSRLCIQQGFCVQAARPAPSGALSTRRFRRPRPAASSTCAVNASSRESNMTMRAVLPAWCIDAAGWAAPACAHRVRRRQCRRNAAPAAAVGRAIQERSRQRIRPGGPQLLSSRVELCFRIFDQPVSFWRGAVLAGWSRTKHPRSSRGFAGGYTWNSPCSTCRPSRSLECLTGGARFRLGHRQLPQHGRHARQWREDAARRQSHHLVDHGEGLVGLPAAHNVHCDPIRTTWPCWLTRPGADGRSTGRGRKRTVVTPYRLDAPDGHARMSHDPGQGSPMRMGARTVPNLFISDGSVQTTAGARIRRSIVALVLRQADHMGARWLRTL